MIPREKVPNVYQVPPEVWTFKQKRDIKKASLKTQGKYQLAWSQAKTCLKFIHDLLTCGKLVHQPIGVNDVAVKQIVGKHT